MSVRGVSFDLDGTLYRARPVRIRFMFRHFFSLADVRVARRVREELRATEFVDGDALFDAEAARFAERRGRSVDDSRAIIDQMFGDDVSAILARVGPRPDARATLLALKARGLKLAVVSDFRVEDKLRALHLDDIPWDSLVAAECVGALKPWPRSFLRAAEEMDVSPSDVLHVGDRADTDGEGARRAGMRTLIVTDEMPLHDSIVRCLSS